MNKENFRKWLKAAAIRAVKTVFQTVAATLSTAAVISEIDWKLTLTASLTAGLLSLITSVAGLPELKQESKA